MNLLGALVGNVEKEENWKQIAQNIRHRSDELRVCLIGVYHFLKKGLLACGV